MSKAWVVVLGLLAACGSRSGSQAGPVQHVETTPGLARVPKVASAGVLVAEPGKPPPMLIVLDDKGALHANIAASWDELATKDALVGAYPTTLARARPRLEEGRALGQPTRSIYESFTPPKPGEPDLDLEDTATRGGTAQDDPPPPEDQPDDGADEIGGVNTAINLDEGKMGKRDSDRAEGQYKMHKADDPQLVAQQQAEHERQLRRAKLYQAAGARQPSSPRSGLTPQNTAVGEVIKDGALDPAPYALLLAAPTAKATDFIATVATIHPLIAAASGGKVRALRIETIPEREAVPEPRHWIELRVGASELAFEAVPDAPVRLAGALDQAAFAAALDRARASRKLDPLTRVDVLVEPTVDVQRVIDVLVALDQAGVVMIGLGRAPEAGSEQAKLRGVRRSEVRPAHPNSQGELDKSVIRAAVEAKLDELRACYDPLLAKQPDLAGTVQTQFFIAPTGKVMAQTAQGVDPALASCVAGVIKTIEFPKSRGGGGTQVNYPFTFAP